MQAKTLIKEKLSSQRVRIDSGIRKSLGIIIKVMSDCLLIGLPWNGFLFCFCV
jgi:hypothetical protein